MTYCCICKEVTENYEERTYWNKIFTQVSIHCTKCGHYKGRYLEKGGEFTDGE